MIHLAIGAASDVGRLRNQNQDCAFVSERVVALADGMGGPPGGDIASLVAIEALRAAVTDPEVETLVEAIEVANLAVWDRGAVRELRGMGTTLCALALIDDGADGDPPVVAVANVGDSRIYQLRDGDLKLKTEDHSLVEEMLRDGRITAEEAAGHGQRNIVTRALGIGPEVEVDAWEIEPEVGDRFLLCSDGLFNEVPEPRIAAAMRRYSDPTETAHHLVELANQGGGRDNITCVVVDIAEGPASSLDASGLGDRIIVPRPDVVADLAGFRAAAPSEPSLNDSDDGYPDEGLDDGEPVRADRSMLPEPAAVPVATRVFTWRTAVFFLAVIAVFAVAAGAVVWYGRSGYFVSIDANDEVAVFQGRPGGLLWFEPTMVESTGLDIAELTPVLRASVESEPQFASFDEARIFLANLADQLDRQPSSTTTTTRPGSSAGSTSTSRPGATTTTSRPTNTSRPTATTSRSP